MIWWMFEPSCSQMEDVNLSVCACVYVCQNVSLFRKVMDSVGWLLATHTHLTEKGQLTIKPAAFSTKKTHGNCV